MTRFLILIGCLLSSFTFASSILEKANKLYKNGQYSKSAELYKEACKRDYSKACKRLAELYTLGMGVENNPSLAIMYLEKACALGDGEACNTMGAYYDVGAFGILPENKTQAKAYFYKACKLGYKIGCKNYNSH